MRLPLPPTDNNFEFGFYLRRSRVQTGLATDPSRQQITVIGNFPLGIIVALFSATDE